MDFGEMPTMEQIQVQEQEQQEPTQEEIQLRRLREFFARYAHAMQRALTFVRSEARAEADTIWSEYVIWCREQGIS